MGWVPYFCKYLSWLFQYDGLVDDLTMVRFFLLLCRDRGEKIVPKRKDFSFLNTVKGWSNSRGKSWEKGYSSPKRGVESWEKWGQRVGGRGGGSRA